MAYLTQQKYTHFRHLVLNCLEAYASEEALLPNLLGLFCKKLVRIGFRQILADVFQKTNYLT